ncbi:hypothetical protein GH714_017744 [Hevea brasiliensis]|uniref:Trm112p-like protein n=1 Tax=Hevea brasiliensis TaxID=3981 RepID=A0A6A6LY70_HEVBR|nr:hypothetical protein GH714_017744 [Hevea brasiliensis]
MRLLTHNMLSSNIKGVSNGFPLRIEVEKVMEKQVDFNPDFLKNMFSKIEWKALVDAARTMGYVELPEEAESSMLDSDEFLRKFHHALLEVHLEEGALVCPETGRRFPVNKGIPNMLLHEDEASETKWNFQQTRHSNHSVSVRCIRISVWSKWGNSRAHSLVRNIFVSQRRKGIQGRTMASGQERAELDARAKQGETVVPGGTGGKSLEAQEHLAEGIVNGIKSQ